MPIPDLFGLLQALGKTGVLEVTLAGERISIWFERGDVIHATSDRAPRGLRLGDILVEQGAIERALLEDHLRSRHTVELIGSSLTRARLISESELHRAVERQIQEIVTRLFDARQAAFVFRSVRHLEWGGRIRLNVNCLILECARLHDEDDARAARAWAA